MGFLDSVKQRAKSQLKTIVLPESSEPRTLSAAHQVLADGLAKIVLIGDKAEIEALAKTEGLDVSGASFVNPANYEKINELSAKLADLRKSKGMTQEEAQKLLTTSPMYLGCMLVKEGIADGMVAGAVNSTADVMR
ncbi:MAG: phosphate acyltransferase, partial [Defluviitaleaceae bacterium]|nr:phosphate acyltransferase [Defluviitaleaceae bacterium]